MESAPPSHSPPCLIRCWTIDYNMHDCCAKFRTGLPNCRILQFVGRYHACTAVHSGLDRKKMFNISANCTCYLAQYTTTFPEPEFPRIRESTRTTKFRRHQILFQLFQTIMAKGDFRTHYRAHSVVHILMFALEKFDINVVTILNEVHSGI